MVARCAKTSALDAMKLTGYLPLAFSVADKQRRLGDGILPLPPFAQPGLRRSARPARVEIAGLCNEPKGGARRSIALNVNVCIRPRACAPLKAPSPALRPRVNGGVKVCFADSFWLAPTAQRQLARRQPEGGVGRVSGVLGCS